MLEVLTTRELATAIWVGAFAVWALTLKQVRRSAAGVLRALFRWKLLAILVGLAAVAVGSVQVLALVGLWEASLLKDAVFWLVFSGATLAFSSLADSADEGGLGSALREQLKVIVLLEFLVATYTFSMPVEMVLVPFAVLVGVVHAVAETREEFLPIRKFFNGILAVTGLVILGFTVSEAVRDLRGLGSLGTVRQLALPPALTVLAIPYVYLVLLVARYETLLLRLRVGPKKPRSVRLYAGFRLFWRLGFSAKRVRLFTGRHAADLMRVQTRADVNSLLATASRD